MFGSQKMDRREMLENGEPGTFVIRSLPVVAPPIPDGGGRILGDTAGEMARILDGPAMRFLAYIEFVIGGRPRGNHVHHRKTEHLYIISGVLRAVFVNTVLGVEQAHTLRAGDLVTVQPECAHVYQAIETSHALEFTSTVFDPTDVDRYLIL
ncbi:cupin domain-containing protein [Mycobacterium sp. BMJ-28]